MSTSDDTTTPQTVSSLQMTPDEREYERKRFQDGYFYPTPTMWGEWMVLSSLRVARGMKAAHIGLCWYLNTFDDDGVAFLHCPRLLPYYAGCEDN